MSSTPAGLTWQLIEEARERITGKVTVTSVLTSNTLDALACVLDELPGEPGGGARHGPSMESSPGPVKPRAAWP